MSIPTDLREQNDPISDASSEWGAATATAASLRALTSIGGASAGPTPQGGLAGAPGPSGPAGLSQLVLPGTVPTQAQPEGIAGATGPTGPAGLSSDAAWTEAARAWAGIQSPSTNQFREGAYPDPRQGSEYQIPILGGAGRALNTGGDIVRRDLSEIGQGFSDMAPQPDNGSPEAVQAFRDRVRGGLGKIAGGALGIAASPFSATAAVARREVVTTDHILNQKFEQSVAALPKEQRNDPVAINDVASHVFDATTNALSDASKDQQLSLTERIAASVVGGLMRLEQVSEYGVPSGAARLPQIAEKALPVVSRGFQWLRDGFPGAARVAGIASEGEGVLAKTAGGVTEEARSAVTKVADLPDMPSGDGNRYRGTSVRELDDTIRLGGVTKTNYGKSAADMPEVVRAPGLSSTYATTNPDQAFQYSRSSLRSRTAKYGDTARPASENSAVMELDVDGNFVRGWEVDASGNVIREVAPRSETAEATQLFPPQLGTDAETLNAVANVVANPQRETVAGFLQTAEQRIAARRGGEPEFGLSQFPGETRDVVGAIQARPEVQNVRTPISLDEQAALANRLAGSSMGSLVEQANRVGPGKVSSLVIEINNRVAGMVQEASGLAEKVAQGTATDGDRLNAALAFREALIGRRAAIGAVSEGARVTGAQGRVAVTARLSKRDQMVGDAIDALARTNPEQFDQIATHMVEIANDQKKLAAMVRVLAEQPSMWDRIGNGFFEYYRGNVLWNVATHVTNTTSGLFQVAAYVAREGIKNPIGVAKALPQVGKGYAYAVAGVLPRRAQQYLSANVGIFDDLADQIAMISASDKYGGITSLGGAIPGPVGEVVRTPFKFLTVADTFQTKPLYNFALALQAEKAGKKLGLSGDALRSFVRDIPASSFDDIHAAAWKDAEEFALHSQSDVARAIETFRNATPIAKLMILFVQTPLNLAKVGVRLSPLGGLRAIPAAFTEAGRARLPNIAAETVVGSGIMAGFLAMLGSDNMTGLRSRSPAEQQLWEAEGRQPMSIRASEYPMLGPALRLVYGDKADKTWVSLNLAGPLVYPGLIAAAAFEASRDGSGITGDHAKVAAAAAGQTILNTIPMFQSYQGINNLLANPSVNTVSQFLANLARPLIPMSSGMAMVERMTDGFKRDPKTLEETLRAQIPGLAGAIRLDHDVLGRTIPVQTGVAGLLPKATTENDTPVLAEDRRLRDLNPNFVGLAMPQNSFGSGANQVQLTPDEFNRLQKLSGEKKNVALTNLLRSPEYKASDDMGKSKMFSRVEAQSDAEARQEVVRSIVRDAQTVDEVERAALAARGALPGWEYAMTLGDMRGMGKLSPEVVQRLDASRGASSVDGERDPTVEQYLRAAPLVKQYGAIPPFRSGTQQDWDAFVEAKALRSRIATDMKEKNNGRVPDERAVDVQLRRIAPHAADLIVRFGDTRSEDSRRQGILDRNPWLEPFVSGLRYKQEVR